MLAGCSRRPVLYGGCGLDADGYESCCEEAVVAGAVDVVAEFGG